MKDFKKIAFSYFSGTITPENEIVLQEFIKQDKDHLMQKWEEEWIQMGCPSVYTSSALRRVNRRIQINSFWKYATAAAAVVLVCIATFSYIYKAETPAEEYITYTTAAGEVMHITLPDSSYVVLNAESSLKVASDMSVKRYVELSGEAWFEVEADTERPFEVASGEMQKVVVTGTKFNVTAYPEDKEFFTTLLEGKVKVCTEKDTVVLMPYEKSALFVSDSTLTKLQANAIEAKAWVNGDIIYSDIAVNQLLHKLERKFGVTIQGGDSITDELSVSFRNNESLEQVMEVVASLAKFEYATSTDGVTIY